MANPYLSWDVGHITTSVYVTTSTPTITGTSFNYVWYDEVEPEYEDHFKEEEDLFKI